MKISFYNGNIKNTTGGVPIDFADFISMVKVGKFKDLYEKISAIEDKDERQKQKGIILPYVTISGTFEKRSNKGLVNHSGLIAVDFDDLNSDIEKIEQQLQNDPHTFALFRSVSGRGLCCVVKINKEPDKHLAHFEWLEKYYFDNFALVIDRACKDVARPRYVSHDPNVYTNPAAKKAGTLQPKKKKIQSYDFVATNSQMDRIVKEICDRHINIAESYEDYLTCAFAISDGYGENGRHYFHAVASQSSKYSSREADKKYDNALKSPGAIKIGSFFYLAKNAGVQIASEEEVKAYSIGRIAKASKSTPESAIKTAVQTNKIDEKTATEIIRQVFENNSISLRGATEDEPIIEQIAQAIDLNYDFYLNTINRRVYNKDRVLDDKFLNTIYVMLKSQFGNKVNKGDIESIIFSDRLQEKNPVLDFYEKNKNRPKNLQIVEDFVNCLQVQDDRQLNFVFRWLLGIPATLHGEVVRIVLVICGKQNTGKSSWFRQLLPEELEPYYAESHLDNGKDDEIGLTQKLIVMDDEFGGRNSRSIEKFKSIISKDKFYLREPYGKYNIDLKRLALIGGTSNDEQLISDSTGNTRILPVYIDGIDYEKMNAIDRTDLLVQLFKLYEQGETWKLTPAENEYLRIISDDFSETNFEREMLYKYFTPDKIGSFYTTSDVMQFLEARTAKSRIRLRILGTELRNFAQRIAKKDDNGAVKRGYMLRELPQGYESSTGFDDPFNK